MAGRIYISSAFKSLKNATCKLNDESLDNDPHFWKQPPTWGICRTDYRRNCKVGDYIFFVLPKKSSLNEQCIYGYLKVKDIITHAQAYKAFPSKRMADKNQMETLLLIKTDVIINLIKVFTVKNLKR